MSLQPLNYVFLFINVFDQLVNTIFVGTKSTSTTTNIQDSLQGKLIHVSFSYEFATYFLFLFIKNLNKFMN